MDFEVKQVFYSYGDILALKGISFSADRGQIIGLVGENGAGKSTIIKNIYRYLVPDSGTITLDGKDIFSYPSEKYPVSYIPDVPVFYEELSLLEHLHFTKAVYPQCDTSIREMLEKLDMQEHQNKIPAALSKGTRQKLVIAMALLREYEILIADEPFSGLDLILKNAVRANRWKSILTAGMYIAALVITPFAVHVSQVIYVLLLSLWFVPDRKISRHLNPK